MRMIVVTGMPGAGKEEFLSAGIKAGVPFVRMGDVVRDTYAQSGAEAEGLSVGQFGPPINTRAPVEKSCRK